MSNPAGYVVNNRTGVGRDRPDDVLYIVGGQDTAEFVQQWTSELNALRVELGQQPVRASVVVADSDAEVEVLARFLHGVPAELGLPWTRVVDLRPALAAHGRASAPSGTGIVFDFPHFQ